MKKHKKIKIKSLCKLSKKEVEENLVEIISLVKSPSHVCSKCARSANDEFVLCHPIDL